MSAFLGPIHHWLFTKIQIQDQATQKLIQLAEEKAGIKGLYEKLTAQYGELENSPLEDVIDGTNIHGWLQERVSLVEYKFADAVTTILNEDKEFIADIENLFVEIGKNHSVSKLTSATDIFKNFENVFLDGMPCDRANETISDDDDEVVWKRNVCVHQQYWDQVGGDIAIYYKLRDRQIEGMLAESQLIYDIVDEKTRRIKRK